VPSRSATTSEVTLLFSAIGVALLLVVAYGWGLAKGTELTRKAQARLHASARDSLSQAIELHQREQEAWLAAQQASHAWLTLRNATRPEQQRHRAQQDDALEAAALAYLATDDVLETLRDVWADPDEPADAARLRAADRALRREREVAQRCAARERRNRADDEERNRLLS